MCAQYGGEENGDGTHRGHTQWLVTLVFFLLLRNLRSSLCCLETKFTAAYSSSAEKTKSRHTAIQMSMAFT